MLTLPFKVQLLQEFLMLSQLWFAGFLHSGILLPAKENIKTLANSTLMLWYPSLFRKKQQGSVGSAVIRVSAALSNPLSSEYLPHHDGLLGRWALQETLLPRPAQPAGFNICQDIFQDYRGIERRRRRGWWEHLKLAAGRTANMKREGKGGWEIIRNILPPCSPLPQQGIYVLKNTKVWKDRGRRASEVDKQKWNVPS